MSMLKPLPMVALIAGVAALCGLWIHLSFPEAPVLGDPLPVADALSHSPPSSTPRVAVAIVTLPAGCTASAPGCISRYARAAPATASAPVDDYEAEQVKDYRYQPAIAVIRMEPGAAKSAIEDLGRCWHAPTVSDERGKQCDELEEVRPLAVMTLRQKASEGDADAALGLVSYILMRLERLPPTDPNWSALVKEAEDNLSRAASKYPGQTAQAAGQLTALQATSVMRGAGS